MHVWYNSKKDIYPRLIMRKRKPEIQGKKLWREKKPCSLKRSLILLNFSSVTAAEMVQWHLFELRGSTSQSRFLYLARVSLNNETNKISFEQQKSLLGVCCEWIYPWRNLKRCTFFFKRFVFIVCTWLAVCMYVCAAQECRTGGGEGRASDALEAELQAIVTVLTGAGTESRSSGQQVFVTAEPSLQPWNDAFEMGRRLRLNLLERHFMT